MSQHFTNMIEHWHATGTQLTRRPIIAIHSLSKRPSRALKWPRSKLVTCATDTQATCKRHAGDTHMTLTKNMQHIPMVILWTLKIRASSIIFYHLSMSLLMNVVIPCGALDHWITETAWEAQCTRGRNGHWANGIKRIQKGHLRQPSLHLRSFKIV